MNWLIAHAVYVFAAYAIVSDLMAFLPDGKPKGVLHAILMGLGALKSAIKPAGPAMVILFAGALLSGCTAAQKATIKQDFTNFVKAEKGCLIRAQTVTDIINAIETGYSGWLAVVLDNADCVHAALASYTPTSQQAVMRANIALTIIKPPVQ